MALTFRSTKGSALTHNELDANFSTLNQERSASEFNATGRTVKFGATSNGLQLSTSGSEGNDTTYSYITLSGGFHYAYPPSGRKNNIKIVPSLNNGESGMLAIVTTNVPFYSLGYSIAAGTNWYWVNNSTGTNSSGNTSANGWGAPSGYSSAFGYSDPLISIWRDSSGDYYARYHGAFDRNYSQNPSYYPFKGYSHIPNP